MSSAAPTLRSIKDAAARIAPHVHRTPLHRSSALDEQAGLNLFFKCESFQRTGSFKIRGATNAIFSLSADVAARGVVTQSSGNHGMAVALAARLRGIDAHVVVPCVPVQLVVAVATPDCLLALTPFCDQGEHTACQAGSHQRVRSEPCALWQHDGGAGGQGRRSVDDDRRHARAPVQRCRCRTPPNFCEPLPHSCNASGPQLLTLLLLRLYVGRTGDVRTRNDGPRATGAVF